MSRRFQFGLMFLALAGLSAIWLILQWNDSQYALMAGIAQGVLLLFLGIRILLKRES